MFWIVFSVRPLSPRVKILRYIKIYAMRETPTGQAAGTKAQLFEVRRKFVQGDLLSCH